MKDGQQIPPTTNSEPDLPVGSLASPPGGQKKPLILIGVLLLLIGGGIFVGSIIGGTEEEINTGEKEVEALKLKPRPKSRKKEKTTERPERETEMAELSLENRGDFPDNVGNWVRLQGKVKIGNEDGVLEFEEPAGMSGQLVRGSATHLSGQIVKVIGWMVSEEKIQIEGIFEITTIDPVDLLPKKDVYTTADAKQLIALRNTRASFKGKVKNVRLSADEKNLYLVFEGESHEFIGSGDIKKLKEVEVTGEILKELIGKRIKLKGKLGYKKQEKKDRIFINFSDKDAYEIV
ncbi:MAG: hypothetical protein P8I39_00260, partial [Akkermansiaceae bacterium]|nr:hypothetical protein [Akkermansiaceae bacterium]